MSEAAGLAVRRRGSRTEAERLVLECEQIGRRRLAPWNVEARSPDEFLIHQYHLQPEVVTGKIKQQAAQHGGLERLLTIQG